MDANVTIAMYRNQWNASFARRDVLGKNDAVILHTQGYASLADAFAGFPVALLLLAAGPRAA